MNEIEPSNADAEKGEIFRDSEKVITISGDWAVHTFLDEQGNSLHSVGFHRLPYFSEADIEASQNS